MSTILQPSSINMVSISNLWYLITQTISSVGCVKMVLTCNTIEIFVDTYISFLIEAAQFSVTSIMAGLYWDPLTQPPMQIYFHTNAVHF